MTGSVESTGSLVFRSTPKNLGAQAGPPVHTASSLEDHVMTSRDSPGRRLPPTPGRGVQVPRHDDRYSRDRLLTSIMYLVRRDRD